MKFEEWIEALAKYRENVFRSIPKDGWFTQMVLKGTDGPDFAYSVGAPQLGLPEVIIIGVPCEYGADLIDALLKKLKGGEPLYEDAPYILAGTPLYLRRLSPKRAVTMMCLCDALHREGFAAFQIVHPDPKGLFPWEPSYDFPAQELLFSSDVKVPLQSVR